MTICHLQGARIIVASFSGTTARPDNPCSTLARRHFGRVRIIDTEKGTKGSAERERSRVFEDDRANIAR